MADKATGPRKKPDPFRIQIKMTLEKTGLAADYAWEANIEAATYPGGAFNEARPAWPWSACGSTPARAAAEAVRWYVSERMVDPPKEDEQ